MSITTTSDTYALAVALCDRHARYERELLSVVFCEPRNGVARAHKCGVNDGTFIDHDHWLIWLALRFAAQEKGNVITALKAAMYLLKADRCGLWSKRKLCDLAEQYSWFPSPMQAIDVRLVAKRLLECHGALLSMDRNAKDTIRKAERVLSRGRAA